MKRRALWILVPVILTAGLGLFLWQRRGAGPPAYVTQKIVRGDVAQVVSATGVLQPVVLSPVGSQVSGIVWKLHADWNDKVQKGQKLVELDPALFDAAVARELANLGSAQAAVRKAQAGRIDAVLQTERAQKLAEKNYISEADRTSAAARAQQAVAEVAAAEAQVQQAQAALQKVRLDRRNSVVLSPVDGVVIARNVEVGQAVVSSFQAPNLFTIAGDLTHMQVLANVDEADIGMVQVNQAAHFTVDAFRGQRFSAKVSQVRNAAQNVQNVVSYVVVLEVDNEALLLKPGMTANVRMEVARRDGVLLLQNAALRFRPRGSEGPRPADGVDAPRGPKGEGRPKERDRTRDRTLGTRATVYLTEGKEPRPVAITTGITDGLRTEVLTGLAEGQEVIVEAARQASSSGPPGAAPSPFGSGNRGGGGGRRGGF